MSLGNQLMRVRVGTHNLSRKVLKPKIFSSEENNFCIVHFLSKIITYLVLTVCSCHVTYAFQSESTLYSCLNVKELLVQSRHEI